MAFLLVFQTKLFRKGELEIQLAFYNYSFDEIRTKITNWTWQELKYGLQKELIFPQDIIDFAINTLSESTLNFDVVLQLSIKNSDEEIEKELNFLCQSEFQESEEKISNKWRYVILENLYNKNNQINNVQEKLDMLYADFDYPKDMEGLVSFMPHTDIGGTTIDAKWFTYLIHNKHYLE